MGHWGRYWGPHQPVCLVCLLLLCLHGRPSACPMSPQFVFICVVMSQSSAPTTCSQEPTTPLSLSACPAPQAAAQSKVLQQAATVMSSKVDNLHAKTIKGRGKTQAAVNCFNPELLQTKEMISYSELCKHIPNVPQSEWVRYIALPAPSPLPDSTAARVAWWHAKKDDFPVLSSIAVFFVRRPRSACHVERTFSLMGHIQTKDRLHMGNDTLRHLAMMYVNKPTTDDPDGESD